MTVLYKSSIQDVTYEDHRLRKGSEDMESAGPENPGAEQLEYLLASGGNVGLPVEQQVLVGKYQEQVPPRAGRARQEPIHLLACRTVFNSVISGIRFHLP